MNNLLEDSVFFGAFISLVSYYAGCMLKKKFSNPLVNPLLISILATILFLIISKTDYDTYYEGAKYISYFMTPATICLAVPLYEQFELLKKNVKAVSAGIISGTFAGLLSILAMAVIFGLNHDEYVTFLPKSVTTAIGLGISEELGGYVAITAAVIIITGIIGNIAAEAVFKLLKIKEPIAKGIALGTASHAMGTAKAMELGEIEGAMGSLSIAVAGILTVIGATIFSHFI